MFYPSKRNAKRESLSFGSGIQDTMMSIIKNKSSNVLKKVLDSGEKIIENELNRILNKNAINGKGVEVNNKLISNFNKKNTLYGKGLRTYKPYMLLFEIFKNEI